MLTTTPGFAPQKTFDRFHKEAFFNPNRRQKILIKRGVTVFSCLCKFSLKTRNCDQFVAKGSGLAIDNGYHLFQDVFTEKPSINGVFFDFEY